MSRIAERIIEEAEQIGYCHVLVTLVGFLKKSDLVQYWEWYLESGRGRDPGRIEE